MPIVAGAAALGLAFTSGRLIGEPSTSSTLMPVVVSPVHVSPTAPEVRVDVAAPAPVPTPVEDKQTPAYRALTPAIDADCVGTVGADDATPRCSWDDGFPAISADGSQIVEAVVPDDGGRGNPGLSIVFTDVATSKVARSITILSPDEMELTGSDEKLRATIARRAAAAQREIDAGKFRALVDLGGSSVAEGIPFGDANSNGVHAEYADAVMRIVDPATRSVLWRHTWTAQDPHPVKKTPDGECQAFYLAEAQSWLDPQTHVVLGRLTYHRGGCLCGSESIAQVFRF